MIMYDKCNTKINSFMRIQTLILLHVQAAQPISILKLLDLIQNK